MKYYVGWDVGAWHCDRNAKSKDALCVLKAGKDGPEITGAVWRGNLKPKLNELRVSDLVRDMLRLCEVEATGELELVFAIDTPLGWPRSMLSLLGGGNIVEVEEFRQNPYLFRETERFLADCGFEPLSAVQDRIGSQSTKGIHFLRATSSQADDVGVWRTRQARADTTIIETYPAPCEKSETFRKLFDPVTDTDIFQSQVGQRGVASRKDACDALRCALIAWLYANELQCLAAPNGDEGFEEG